MKPSKLNIATTTAGFAMQRRAIRAGKWAGFGESAEGAVDRRVRVLECRDQEGNILGAAYMYACHCTTLGGDSIKFQATGRGSLQSIGTTKPRCGLSADHWLWSRRESQAAQPDTTSLSNMLPNWSAVCSKPWAVNELRSQKPPQVHFGHAGLAPEQPSPEEVDRRARQAPMPTSELGLNT